MRYSTHLHQHFPISLLAALGTIALATSIASADSAGQNQQQIKVSLAQKAKVRIDQAISTTSKTQPGTVIKAVLEKEHGPVMWELEIVTDDGTIHEVHVDAERGEVVGLHAQEGKEEKSATAIHTGAFDQKAKQASELAPEQNSSKEQPAVE